MEINFASSDSLRLGGRWVREGESVTKWGNRSNISHLLIGCKTIYMWWGDIAWFFELLHLQWFVKLSHGWKGPNVKKIQSIRPKVTLNNPWHPYLTRFELNFSKLPLIIRPPPWCAASWQSRGLTDWHLASSGRRLFGGSNPQETGSCPPPLRHCNQVAENLLERPRLRWSTRRQSVLPCDVSIQCLCQILRSWSVPHVSVSIPAISVRSSGHPSKRLPPATLGRTWGHPCVSLCLLGADPLAHTPSRQTATQVLVKRKLGINSALSTHKGLLPLLSVDHLVEIPSQQYLAETNKSLISFIPASTKKILSNLFFRCVAVYGNKSI